VCNPKGLLLCHRKEDSHTLVPTRSKREKGIQERRAREFIVWTRNKRQESCRALFLHYGFGGDRKITKIMTGTQCRKIRITISTQKRFRAPFVTNGINV
jgi:hypothetical protein